MDVDGDGDIDVWAQPGQPIIIHKKADKDEDKDEDEVELDSEFDDVEDDSASTDRESLDFLHSFFSEVRFLRFFLVVFFCLTFRLAVCWGLGEGVLAAMGVAFSGSLLGEVMLAVAAVILLGR